MGRAANVMEGVVRPAQSEKGAEGLGSRGSVEARKERVAPA